MEPDGRVQPVPGLGRAHEVELCWPPGWLPRLEIAHVYAPAGLPGEIAPGHRGHGRVGFDTDPGETSRRQQYGRLPGAAAEVKGSQPRRTILTRSSSSAAG